MASWPSQIVMSAGDVALQPGPATDSFNITPNDAADLPKMIRAIKVGTAGNLRYLKPDGTERTIAVQVGTTEIAAIKVFASNTTAANLVGLV